MTVQKKDPSLIVRARLGNGADATTLLTVYLVFLIGCPSQLVVGPLGSAGTPAALVGLMALLWWIWDRFDRHVSIDVGRRPVRFAMGMFVAIVGVSYVLAMVRPINSQETSTANSALLTIASWFGILLIANDAISSIERLKTLLRRLTFAGGALASLGVLQFATKRAFTEYIVIPGLTLNLPLYPVLGRSGFARPAGTALHPIEFGTTLTVILPIALTCAMNERSRSLVRRWFPVAVMALAIPLSVSRSSLVGAAVGLIVLLPTWSARARRGAVVSILFLVAGVFLAVPGMLGVLSNLFTDIGTDSSTQSRTGSYEIAWEFIQRSPFLGRGLGTFLPKYRIFDNQYLGLLVEVGVMGLFAMLFLLVVAFVAATRSRRLRISFEIGQDAQSLAASVTVATFSMALFDAFSFPMFMGLTFFVLGLTGGLWRLARGERLPSHVVTAAPNVSNRHDSSS